MWRWFLCCCCCVVVALPARAQLRAPEPDQTRLTTAQPGDRWELLPLRYIRAAEVAAMFGYNGDGREAQPANGAVFQLPDGVRRLAAHPMLNVVAALGTADGIQELRDLLALLDVPAQRISYQVTAAAVTEAEIDKLGLTWTSPTNTGRDTYHLEVGAGDLAQARTQLLALDARYRCQAPPVVGDNGQPVACRLNNGPLSGAEAPLVGLELVGRVVGAPPDTKYAIIVHGCSCTVPLTPKGSGEPGYLLFTVSDVMVRAAQGGVAIVRLAGPLRDGRQTVLIIAPSILPPLT